MYFLALCGVAGDDKSSVKSRWRELAELGHDEAQHFVATNYCAEQSVERFVWLRSSMVLGFRTAQQAVVSCVEEQLRLYESGGSGRIVFEMGAALQGSTTWRNDCGGDKQLIGACLQVIALHQQWCAAAKRAVRCWMWLSRDMGVMKDIRVIIADCIWAERMTWRSIPAPA